MLSRPRKIRVHLRTRFANTINRLGQPENALFSPKSNVFIFAALCIICDLCTLSMLIISVEAWHPHYRYFNSNQPSWKYYGYHGSQLRGRSIAAPNFGSIERKQGLHFWGKNDLIRPDSITHARLPRPWKDFTTFISKDDADWCEESTSNNNIREDEDWRAFRAQLVRSESNNNIEGSRITSFMGGGDDKEELPIGSTRWAYDTGDFVERGSIVLSVPSSDAIANDIDALNNQCYRKCMVLVLDVRQDFIQGVILNRPTNIGVKEGMKFVRPGHGELFEDEIGFSSDGGAAHRWKVWFGGEVGGPYSDYPQMVCLHSVMTDLGKQLSEVVLPGILVSPVLESHFHFRFIHFCVYTV